jgi:DNA helicase HerA-like ATPase
MATNLIIGAADRSLVQQLGRMSNRHGLVAGATGTGKTVTLQVLAEGFSRMGVPVFAVDVKGNLSGIAAAGKPHPKLKGVWPKSRCPTTGKSHSPTVL